jgi:hypothetical protein
MSYKIHPGIGVARVGDSPSRFVGPETADEEASPSASFRDDQCRIKRQGARFRVFHHTKSGPVEVTVAEAEITWTVEIGIDDSKKAPPLQLTGPHQEASLGAVDGVSLGQLFTDEDGRLIVYSGIIDDNFDGIAGGSVKATVKPANAKIEDAVPSWVAIAPPDFAPAIRPVLSAYDRMRQAYVGTAFEQPAPSHPSFLREIYPILKGGNDLALGSMFSESDLPYLSGKIERGKVTEHFRVATAPNVDWFEITPLQEAVLQKWVDHSFTDDWSQVDVPRQKTPFELDRGPLDHCLHKNTGWDFSVATGADASLYLEPFRFNPEGRSLGGERGGLQSWRPDLSPCISEWPAQTTLLGHAPPVGPDLWRTHGFVVREDDELTVDNSCKENKVKKTHSEDFVTVHEVPAAGRVILNILGGGLGDGAVVVMTKHGPVVIGPGDPLYKTAKHLHDRIARDGKRLLRAAKEHGKKKEHK